MVDLKDKCFTFQIGWLEVFAWKNVVTFHFQDLSVYGDWNGYGFVCDADRKIVFG